MAVENKRIMNYRGPYNKFDKSQALDGEISVITSGDPHASDGRAAYLSFDPGTVKRLATYEDMVDNVDQATEEIVQKVGTELAADMKAATENANVSADTADAKASLAAEAATKADESAEEAVAAAEEAKKYVLGDVSSKSVTFTQASADADIKSGDTLAALFGKILKRFNVLKTKLGSAALTTTAKDLSGATNELKAMMGSTTLQTTAKDLSAAINEHETDLVALASDITLINGNLVDRRTKSFTDISQLGITSLVIKDIMTAMPTYSTFMYPYATSDPFVTANDLPSAMANGVIELIKTGSTNRTVIRLYPILSSGLSGNRIYYGSYNVNTNVLTWKYVALANV